MHRRTMGKFALLGLIVAAIGLFAWGRAALSRAEGVIYYVLTEDNEITLRYTERMGGDVLTRRAFEVMMIEKVDRLNEIAEKHGAKWTHMTAVGTWDMALHAAEHSDAWIGLYEALTDQVRRGSAAGHEYAPHPHAHWDPRTSLNAAVWDPEQNGFVDSWDDYLSWTTGFGRLGDYDELESAVGYLYDYKKRLMDITRRHTMVHRSGGWQFGATPLDMGMSIVALQLNGILANSDADSNLTLRANPGKPYGQALYFTPSNDINRPAASAARYGTLQFAPTPHPLIEYDRNSVDELNAKVDAGIRHFTDARGRIKPGVHFIVGFTHAKNMMGDGDWDSTDGGAFDNLDRHLEYVATTYVNIDRPRIRFATATEAVIAYYDAHSERPVAILADEERQLAPTVYEYPLRVLGRFGRQYRETTVQPPIWWDARTHIDRVDIVADGQTIASHTTFDSAYPQLVFSLDAWHHDDAPDAVMRVTLRDR